MDRYNILILRVRVANWLRISTYVIICYLALCTIRVGFLWKLCIDKFYMYMIYYS
mgnify:FL=1